MSSSNTEVTGTSAPEATPTTRDEAVRAAYSAAQSALREKYRDEFNKDVSDRVKAAGFEWAPRPTAAEKAKAQIEALLAANPEVAAEFKKS